jgi:inosine-uridine nucleoside N-ribohydrolase
MNTNTDTKPRLRVLIDCDPGQDDVIAIAVAAAHCDIVGITTVAGNAPLHHTVQNARIACDLFGLDHVPVHSGAHEPLAGQRMGFAEDVHGRTGLNGPPRREPSRSPDGSDAVTYLIDTLRAEPGLSLIVTGPMTNIAQALRRAPDILDSVNIVSFMGGSATHGNITSTAEFNVLFDPEAAEIVLGSHAPLRMAGLDLTHQITGDVRMIQRFHEHGTIASIFCAQLQEHYLDFYVHLLKCEPQEVRFPLHDPTAVLALTHPHLFTFSRHQVEVECAGVHTRGMTVVDRRPWTLGVGNVELVVNPQVDASVALIEAAVTDPTRPRPSDFAE